MVMEQLLFDPFKLAEFLGHARGFIVQFVVSLDAGESYTATVIPPEDVVWWWTLCGLGDVPSSSLYLEWITKGKTVTGIYKLQKGTILFDEAWMAKLICPSAGWTRVDYEAIFKVINVTGQSAYNDLVAQTIKPHCTVTFVEVDRKFVEWVEEQFKVVM